MSLVQPALCLPEAFSRMADRLPPRNDYDWLKYDSKINEVAGHIEVSWTANSGSWSKPEFVADPFIRIHGLAPGLNYGQQVYEGIKACRNPEGEIIIFRPDAHARRFARSASFVSVPAVPTELFLECVHAAVAANASYVPPHGVPAALYIRPVVFGSSCQIGLDPPDEYLFCIFVQPHVAFHGHDPVPALVLDEFDRAAPRGTGSAKVGGNYAPMTRWAAAAKSEGFGVLLHLDSKTQTHIDEFSTSAFLGVKVNGTGQKQTLVVPDSPNVIPSITSNCCIQIARSLGWEVEIRPVPYGELAEFDEVLAAGTAAGLVAIRSITRKLTSDKFEYILEGNQCGKAFGQLSSRLRGIQKGLFKDEQGWCHILKTSFIHDKNV